MSSEGDESAQEWAERAIVANSLAAAQEESLADSGDPIARLVARKRAQEAAVDLRRALEALQEHRRINRD